MLIHESKLMHLLRATWLLTSMLALGCMISPVAAQPASEPGMESEPSLEKLEEQIRNLSSPSYRTRQLAIWYLEQNPRRALPLLRAAGKTTDLNIGAEVVNMLSAQAMETDESISVNAHEVLKEIAGGSQSVTAVSHLALDALAASPIGKRSKPSRH